MFSSSFVFGYGLHWTVLFISPFPVNCTYALTHLSIQWHLPQTVYRQTTLSSPPSKCPGTLLKHPGICGKSAILRAGTRWGLRFQGDTKPWTSSTPAHEAHRCWGPFRGWKNSFAVEWHKLALSVKGEQVKLLVDCDEVSVGVSGWTTARDPARFYLHRQEGPVGDDRLAESYQDRLEYFTTDLSGWVQMFLLFTRHQNIKFCEMQKAMFFRKSTIFNTK